MTDETDIVEFDDRVALALAEAAAADAPPASPDVKRRLMERVRAAAEPAGFVFHWARDDRWLPHPVPGIKMRVLAVNKKRGYATLLFDVAPGTRFRTITAAPRSVMSSPAACSRAADALSRAISSTRRKTPTTASCGPRRVVR